MTTIAQNERILPDLTSPHAPLSSRAASWGLVPSTSESFSRKGDNSKATTVLSVPYTLRFLGLCLRLAFTKRRFAEVEATYKLHYGYITSVNSTVFSTASASSSEYHNYIVHEVSTTMTTTSYNDNINAGTAENRMSELARFTNLLEASIASLRNEIYRIEERQKQVKQKASPTVRNQLYLHESFLCFLNGFRVVVHDHNVNDDEQNPEEDFGRSKKKCHLPLLDKGTETTTAIKRLIAEFAGVPLGRVLYDLRILAKLLEQKEK